MYKMTVHSNADKQIINLRRFARNEDGMISAFAIMMVLLMLLIGGIGADYMRHEMERTRIQAVADRAVLAAVTELFVFSSLRPRNKGSDKYICL